MTGTVPFTRQEWRAWVREVNPGEVRRRAGVRQEDLAARLGIGQSTLAGWELGSSVPGTEAGFDWYEAVTEMQDTAGTEG